MTTEQLELLERLQTKLSDVAKDLSQAIVTLAASASSDDLVLLAELLRAARRGSGTLLGITDRERADRRLLARNGKSAA